MLVSYNESNLLIVVVCVILCLLVLAYNFYYARRMGRWENRRSKWGSAMFHRILEDQKAGRAEQAIRYLSKQLNNPEKLVALRWLYDGIDDLPQAQMEEIEDYIRSAISKACANYKRASTGAISYLLAQIERFAVRTKEVNDFLIALLSRSPRLLILAMRGIAFSADEETMYRAIIHCGTHPLQCTDKLITDTLMNYDEYCDSTQLNEKIHAEMRRFRDGAQCAIIGYWIQTKNAELRENMREEAYRLMIDPDTPWETGIATVKYFGTVYDERAKAWIISLMQQENITWEVKVNCAKSLSLYPDSEVTSTLKAALSDGNWYVRLNAANTLVRQCVITSYAQTQLFDDSFARDISAYALSIYDKRQEAKTGGV